MAEHPLHDLMNCLDELIAAHEALLSQLQQKRQALRQADIDTLTRTGQRENEHLRTIGELEKRRIHLVGELTLQFHPTADRPFSLAELAEHLNEAEREQLLKRRGELIERMQRIRHATSITRRATESLRQHVEGLVQAVQRIAAGTTTYAASGTPAEQSGSLRTINMQA